MFEVIITREATKGKVLTCDKFTKRKIRLIVLHLERGLGIHLPVSPLPICRALWELALSFLDPRVVANSTGHDFMDRNSEGSFGRKVKRVIRTIPHAVFLDDLAGMKKRIVFMVLDSLWVHQGKAIENVT